MSNDFPTIFSLNWFLVIALAFLGSLLIRLYLKRKQKEHGKNWSEVVFANTNKFRTSTWFYIAFFIYVMLLYLGLAVGLVGVSIQGIVIWLSMLLFVLFILSVSLIPNWIYNDAKKRGMNNAADWANSVGLTRRIWPFIYLIGYFQERRKFPIMNKVENKTEKTNLIKPTIIWLVFAVLFFLFFSFIYYSMKSH